MVPHVWLVRPPFILCIYRCVCGDSLQRWVTSIPYFQKKIAEGLNKKPNKEVIQWNEEYNHNKLDNYIAEVGLEKFRPFAILDCMNYRTYRPGTGPMKGTSRRRKLAKEIQRCVYSGYIKAHGLKSLTVMLLNGLFGYIYVTSMLENDVGIYNMSRLEEYLIDIIPRMKNSTLYPSICSDSIFKRLAKQSKFVQTKIETKKIETKKSDNNQINIGTKKNNDKEDNRHKALNRRMNSKRQAIELLYGKLFLKYNLLRKKYHAHLLRKGELIQQIYVVSFF